MGSRFRLNADSDEENAPLLNATAPLVYDRRKPSEVRRRFEYCGPLSPGHAEGIPVEIRYDEHTISANYESQDYETCENTLFLDEERRKTNYHLKVDDFSRWIVMALVGIFTALVACCIDLAVDYLSLLKYSVLKHYVDKYTELAGNWLVLPFLLWVALNAGPVLIASILASIIEPVAAGSGIPEVKCYLNGVKIPRIVRFRTLFAKAVGVTFAVVGGLAVGKEGPMIHSGAVIGAGISQGRSTSFARDFKIFKHFRSDRDKRDFVSGGTAAGVSAAFGAPVGGVLFSLEEGASFWNQALTWKIFFCSMVSTFTLNMVLSSYYGVPARLDYTGLLNFGKFETIPYEIWELLIFILMGAIGGIFGAIFNFVNHKLTVFRIRHVYSRWAKVLEAILVSIISASVGFTTIYFLSDDCKPLGRDPTKYPIQFYCGDGQYNAVASLWFQTPEASVKSLFHDPPGSHQAESIAIFFLLYFLLSCWTYGLGVPSGLFIPSLLTGAAWGRLIGMLIQSIAPQDNNWAIPGKYALIGAAAQLGGVVRMTLSLTVILIEATGNITFGLPIMIVLVSAKWVGDFFNEGIYDMHIQLANVPLLGWEPPPLAHNTYASEVMSHPVTTFNLVEKVKTIVHILEKEDHNGFPVVDAGMNEFGDSEQRRYKGLILRSQLLTLLQKKAFNETADDMIEEPITLDDFRANYPVLPSLKEVCSKLELHELNFTLDLQPYMNPSTYTVLARASLPRIFHLFRGLGLRHLVVVTETNDVIGIVTRKDLARYRVKKTDDGLPKYKELQISVG